MDFRILGPLEVHSDGQILDLGGAKQRALLAVLLLHANQVVSQDRLVDALWEDEPPGSAQKALQVYVSGLRKLLGRDRLETKPPGYLLRIHDDELDLARFRRLCKEGRPGEALALWRGPPLDDFAYQHFAQAEITRLEDQRLACLEERIDEDLDVGRHAELTGELEALVAENPLRERLRGQLMLALYRSGRQAEALDAYLQGRVTLVDELGIEPSRELRELQQAVLNQDPALDLPRQTAPAERPGSSTAQDEAPLPERLGRPARKTVTALFIDIHIVSTRRETVDPEALRRVAARSLDVVGAVVERHGGEFETVAGTAFTIVFGLPIVHEDDALRAVRAALEARHQLESLSAQLRADSELDLDVRLGVATGEVVVGGEIETIGAIGEPLTRSAALAQSVDSGAIVVDDPVRRLLRDAIVVEPAHDGWCVVGLATDGESPARRTSPMIGRERERRRLHDVFDQAVDDRSCQLFTVLGPAGVGKSRLARQFLADIAGRALVARGRCLPYGEGITYWPLLEAVKDAVGLDDTDSSEEAQLKLSEALSEVGGEHAALQVAEMIGVAEATRGAEGGAAAVQALFEALGRRGSVVLVFDDIHWGEPSFLDLVEHLIDWLRDVPLLLICLARPELLEVRPDWGGGKLNATSILLEPLSEQESVELIANLSDSDHLDESVRRRIVAAGEGNPLFLEEMLALAAEGESGGELIVPPTIQALLAARLDRLGHDERAVLDVAAVHGKVFTEEAVNALLSPRLAAAEVSSALGSAVQKELIRPDRSILGGRTYRFRHLLIRDAAYDSIPKEARAELHAAFGQWLDGVAGDRVAEYEEIVGYHLEQAYRYRAELGTVDDAASALGQDAARRLAAASRRAFVRSDASAGVNLSSRAAALLPPDDPYRVELIPNVRVVQGLGGDLSWADHVLSEAVEVAAAGGDRRLGAHALVQRGFLRLFTAADVTPDELLETAERATRVFEEFGDQLGLARSWRLIAQAHYLARQAGPSGDAAQRALVHARQAGDRFEERETIQWLSVVLFLGPKPAHDAAAACRQLLEATAGQPALEVHVLGALSYLLAIQGRRNEAEALAASADRLMQGLGEGWLFPVFAGFEVLWQHGREHAERKLRRGYDTLKDVGEQSHFCTVAALLARLAYADGDYEQAHALTLEAEEAAATNDVHVHILWRSTRAKVLARQGKLQAAERLGREAIAYAAASDFLTDHGDALVDLAEVLTLAGRPREATAAAREAIGLYERKGNALAAGTTREWLEAVERQNVT